MRSNIIQLLSFSLRKTKKSLLKKLTDKVQRRDGKGTKGMKYSEK